MIELGVLLILAAAFGAREYLFARERQDWIAERSSLLNRIKPETAQIQGLPQDFRLVEPVRTDEDYWAARDEDPYAYQEPQEKPFADYPQDQPSDTAVMRAMTPPNN